MSLVGSRMRDDLYSYCSLFVVQLIGVVLGDLPIDELLAEASGTFPDPVQATIYCVVFLFIAFHPLFIQSHLVTVVLMHAGVDVRFDDQRADADGRGRATENRRNAKRQRSHQLRY